MLDPYEVSNQLLHHPLWENQTISITIKRLDMVHPLASGNKFYKLKYNLEAAKTEKKQCILTFGGAYSNHIYATAAACQAEGIRAIGIIRGEAHHPLNPTLHAASAMGMHLEYIDREKYREKKDPIFHQQLMEKLGDCYVLPEGGTNAFAIQGTAEILTENDEDFTHICTAIGTGGTFAGLAKSIKENQTLLGYSSLKGEFIHQEIKDLLENHNILPLGNARVIEDYHFGGYGKIKPELLDFVRWFYKEFNIPIEPIYTAKMIFGILDQLQKSEFPKGSKILILHTGGLQGLAGFNARYGTSLPL
ncbi:1-aminocyclopropane-1-carboxylate deaminase/D-cysteine desulfhydrase [Belliella kenyensis]|uniref:1-aminocyclopropane-1-carboxylate deaminase/D-cysteine desulfhydrase n=1 Tax=Belliella kenyensis TaxID=1472724 RepID=A0ABV8ELX8_9BACT|nr:pyridoxal-phosphate dependent enzyme [Belliella kenyensis]MCH7401309.1 pyridoxal-phosphate dependent enzyme [Belliella kenyensis]MDN3602754.1 pyridoxal-phosphate dependent enzyme [Belliella kenyensis]